MEVLVIIVSVVGFFLIRGLLRKRPRDRRRTDTITGKAYVTDGDGLRVAGQEIRLAGLDAPEWNQLAKHRDGYWFKHGKRVKSALIQRIGGKHVHVMIEKYDKYGRAIGTVTCNSEDVGAWLVREGHAIAAYGDQYKHLEREARRAGRGMWNHATNIDPRVWRHSNRQDAVDVVEPGQVPVEDSKPPRSALPDDVRLIELKWAWDCDSCGAKLPVGRKAYWSPKARGQAWCLMCFRNS